MLWITGKRDRTYSLEAPVVLLLTEVGRVKRGLQNIGVVDMVLARLQDENRLVRILAQACGDRKTGGLRRISRVRVVS